MNPIVDYDCCFSVALVLLRPLLMVERGLHADEGKIIIPVAAGFELPPIAFLFDKEFIAMFLYGFDSIFERSSKELDACAVKRVA